VCEKIAEEMYAQEPGHRNVRHIVDLTFDAFDSGGAAALSSWMLLTGNDDALDPILAAIQTLIDNLTPDAMQKQLYREDTMALVVMALGDAQIGTRLAGAMDLHRDTARILATELIESRIAQFLAAHEQA
jgi:hypothetical protein